MIWPIQFLHFQHRKTHHSMKKKPEAEEDEDQQLEILKAVAQAWHTHSGSSKTANEFDAHRRTFQPAASRFRQEAARSSSAASFRWDFRQSLWDSYEIVTLSKKLETDLLIDANYSFGGARVHRTQRESSNSLRNLFNRVSSRRFIQPYKLDE